ncbi:MAG: response regulator [Pseudohongiellaceae bacterium]|nr:response regulator [Pseudohongiellaceae bacterium]
MLDANDQSQIRIMLVDEHELIRCGMARIINDEYDMDVIAQADSGETALSLLESIVPDVIMLDVKISGMGGIETAQRIKREHPGIKIVAMSSLSDGVMPARMLRAGATAYISNCVSVSEMLRAVRLVHSGQRYITPRIANMLSMARREEEKSPFDNLSEREMQVALMLLESQKVNTISDQLCLSPKTVYSYRYRIFEKLGLSSDVELTILAVKHGLSDASNSKRIDS